MKAFVLIFLVVSVSASAVSEREAGKPGCHTARIMYLLASMYAEVMEEDLSFVKEVRAIKAKACAGEYEKGDTIRYPNGQSATLFAGSESATWSWPNGSTFTLFALKTGATWSWPNGQTMTLFAYQKDATWSWPNARLITHFAGTANASYYGPDGSTYSHSGPELLDSRGEVDMEAFLEYIEGSIL